MTFNWTEASNTEGGGEYAERLPAGMHKVQITGVVHGGKGGPFESAKGEPQILIIFSDTEAREAAQMCTLSEKAGWVLARLLKSCDPPADLVKMSESGISPQSFADPEFAETNLVGRNLCIRVEWKESQNGKSYSDILPVDMGEYDAALDAAQQSMTTATEEVPF